MLAPVLHEFFLTDAFAGREGQTPPFEGRAHAAPALAKITLIIKKVMAPLEVDPKFAYN